MHLSNTLSLSQPQMDLTRWLLPFIQTYAIKTKAKEENTVCFCFFYLVKLMTCIETIYIRFFVPNISNHLEKHDVSYVSIASCSLFPFRVSSNGRKAWTDNLFFLDTVHLQVVYQERIWILIYKRNGPRSVHWLFTPWHMHRETRLMGIICIWTTMKLDKLWKLCVHNFAYWPFGIANAQFFMDVAHFSAVDFNSFSPLFSFKW